MVIILQRHHHLCTIKLEIAIPKIKVNINSIKDRLGQGIRTSKTIKIIGSLQVDNILEASMVMDKLEEAL